MALTLRRHRGKRIKEENAKFKRMDAEISIELDMAKYLGKKSFKALPKENDCINFKESLPERYMQGVQYSKNKLVSQTVGIHLE